MMADVPDDETIALRATVIDGNGFPDDYQVIWRGLSIGRIMKGTGSPMHAPQWWRECNINGQPSLGVGRGTGSDLYDCQAQIRIAWARIRGGITEEDIAEAHRYAEASREALARYYRTRKHEIQRGSPVRQPRGRRAGIARAGERDGSRSCRSTVGRRHQQTIPGSRR